MPGRPANAQPASRPLTTEIVVRMATPAVPPSAALADLPAVGVTKALVHDRYLLRVPISDAQPVLARLRRDPLVSYAGVPKAVHAASLPNAPNDPCYVSTCPVNPSPNAPSATDSGYLNAIGAPAAWSISHGDGVTVAVLDSGIDDSHPDLSSKVVGLHDYCTQQVWEEGTCADIHGQPAEDDFGHGTHVAGIAGAATNNGTGIASLGWGVNLDVYKVLTSLGEGTSTDIADAIYAAVTAGDRVINMSITGASDPDEQAAVEYALSRDVVVVAAAGNNYSDSPEYPASYPGVLSVAATDNTGTVQDFSNYGSAADIAAPGVGILSTWNDGYFQLEGGTSMSAPQVAAAAALMISNKPSLTGPQITQLLESDTSPIRPGGHPIAGGLLNAPSALIGESNPPSVYDGYDLAGSDGNVYSFGTSVFSGDESNVRLNQPVVGISRTADGLGYWLVARDGGIFNFGDAGFYGSTGNRHLNAPIVGMAEDPATHGYWLVAADGGVFNFNAPYLGSMGSSHLNQPVVGIAATPNGNGYWLVAPDGGIFNFGGAGFFGSTGAIRLNQPVVGMASTGSGNGYWLVAADGGIFNFGDARFHGSLGGQIIPAPVVGGSS